MKDEYKEILCRVRFIDGVPAKTYLSDIEIVRCKDCKWHQGKDCMAWDDGTVAVANEVEDDGYCYLAERKEE